MRGIPQETRKRILTAATELFDAKGIRTVAVISFSSGALYSAYDWKTVNWATAVPMVLALLSVAKLKWRQAVPLNG